MGSSSVPVTKQEHKQVAQDYKEILKNSNVIVLPFSICNGKSLDAVVDKWIPALMKLQGGFGGEGKERGFFERKREKGRKRDSFWLRKVTFDPFLLFFSNSDCPCCSCWL